MRRYDIINLTKKQRVFQTSNLSIFANSLFWNHKRTTQACWHGSINCLRHKLITHDNIQKILFVIVGIYVNRKISTHMCKGAWIEQTQKDCLKLTIINYTSFQFYSDISCGNICIHIIYYVRHGHTPSINYTYKSTQLGMNVCIN